MYYKLFVSVAIAAAVVPMVGQWALADSQHVTEGDLSGLVAEAPSVIESPDIGGATPGIESPAAETGLPVLPEMEPDDSIDGEDDAATPVISTSGEPSIQDAPPGVEPPTVEQDDMSLPSTETSVTPVEPSVPDAPLP